MHSEHLGSEPSLKIDLHGYFTEAGMIPEGVCGLCRQKHLCGSRGRRRVRNFVNVGSGWRKTV